MKNQVVIETFRRYVSVKSGNSSGTGVIITTNIVMTCFHSLRVDEDVFVCEVMANILAVDPKHDISLLSVRTPTIPTVTIGEVELGDVVFTVCNPMDLGGALMFGRVCHQSDDRIITDIHGVPGISGSGLFNLKGELVGINHSVVGQKNHGNWLLCAVPSADIQNVLLTVIRQETIEG